MYPGLNNAPPSPPETHASYFSQVPAHHFAPQRAMATPNSSFDLNAPSSLSSAPMETPTSRFRRGSSIGYISTPGHRELKERNGSVGSKLLVIVVPPTSVAQEHGNLGHTLSMGPAHRLSQGLIMPLLPTMYGQLTAIAREFSFPSPTGICLYYCYTEHGVTMTPRLSDDIWQTVWGLADSSAERRAPIVGKLEFDIDMSQARWYTAWLASRHREANDFPTPITAPNLPFRGDNRFTFPPTASEDGPVDHSTQLRSAPVMSRHIPRKLSLIDRYEVGQSEGKASRSANSPPTVLPLSSHVLSPIRQQEEPKSAGIDLNDRVRSWRASAIVASPAELSSEPVPADTVKPPSEAASPASQSSFHLEDYAFSISSAGPDDSSFVGSYHQSYLPSVHLCDRLNGSVCMTESYCTSPGRSDGEFFDYLAMDADSRLPSPDIAYRMFEEAPPSPSPTATSWGAPSPCSWSAFSSEVYSPSIDLAFRMNFSAAPSPAPTATSWGATSFNGWESPLSHQSYFSVHLCDRGEFSTLPTPQTATSWGAPSCLNSPVSPDRLPSPDAGHRSFEDSEEFERRAALAAAWVPAASDEVVVKPWAHSWPYRRAGVSLKTVSKVVSSFSTVPKLLAPPRGRKASASSKPVSSSVSSGCSQYPSFVLYAPVYPHFDLYPAPAAGVPFSENACKLKELPVALASITGYPFFILYIPVYPHFDLYPQSVSVHMLPVASGSGPARLGCPVTTLPTVKATTSDSPGKPWNHSWPYRTAGGYGQTIDKTLASSSRISTPSPKDVTESRSSTQPWAHSWPYRKATVPVQTGSMTQPWAHSWPYRQADVTMKSVTSPAEYSQYPYFLIYPSVYPHFNLYPAPSGCHGKTETRQAKSMPIAQRIGYPSFIIYPAVYPFNLSEMYPGSALESWPASEKVHQPCVEDPLAVLAGYPSLCIYRPVYPHHLKVIYPFIHSEPTGERTPRPCAEDPLAVFSEYPTLSLYRPVYPHSLQSIYPSIISHSNVKSKESGRSAGCMVQLISYPALQIYSFVYPHNLYAIYPGPAASHVQPSSLHTHQGVGSGRPASPYPYFNLYPPVYPHFSLWPSTPALEVKRPSTDPVASPALLQLSTSFQPAPNRCRTGRPGRLTHAELHAMVMVEQRLSSSLPSNQGGSDLSAPSSPAFMSPVKRAGSVRFAADVARGAPSSVAIRSSTLPLPRRSEEPRRDLPPIPSMSLSRSSTLPFRRPPPTTDGLPGARNSIYNPENVRARGLRNNTMSATNLDKRVSTLQRRMTIWEDEGAAGSLNPRPAPSIRQAAKNRDSIVMQRIKAFNSS